MEKNRLNGDVFGTIRRYNTNKMTNKERNDFEKEMRKDNKLNKEVEFDNDLQFVIKHKQLLDVSNQLEGLKNRPIPPSNGSPLFKSPFITGGLMTVFIVGIILYFVIPKTTKLPEPAITLHLPIDSLENKFLYNISPDSTGSTAPYYRGLQAFNKHEYDKALKELELMNIREEVDYHKGVIYVRQAKPEKGIPLLENIMMTTMDNYLELSTSWYLGMYYLRTQEYDKVVKYLSPLQEEELYEKDVKAILERLPLQ